MPGQRRTVEEHLPEGRGDYRQRSRAYWEERADAIDPEVGAYVREIFASDDVLYQLRTVQAIVRHLETFPRERARGAAQRARLYANYTYGSIKKILREALDLEAAAQHERPGNAMGERSTLRPRHRPGPLPQDGGAR